MDDGHLLSQPSTDSFQFKLVTEPETTERFKFDVDICRFYDLLMHLDFR